MGYATRGVGVVLASGLYAFWREDQSDTGAPRHKRLHR